MLSFVGVKVRTSVAIKAMLTVGLCAWLAGCAMVQSKSNKEPAFTQKLDRVAVWSGITRISYLSGPLKPSTPFPESFQRGLMAEFAKRGIAATYAEQKTLPAMSPEDVQAAIKLETGTPSTRLMISIKQTAWMQHAGFAHLDKVIFDVSLYSVTTGQRVWRAEIAVDASIDVPKWNESTANKFVGEIFGLLKKDALI